MSTLEPKESTPKESKKPWDSWPFELPSFHDKLDCKELALLHDEKFHRELNMEIRKMAFERMLKEFKNIDKAAVVLQGGTEKSFAHYDTDTDKCPFRQESYFQYLFAINEPDCFGVLDLERKESLLFVPEVSEESERWNGTRRPLHYYADRYGIHAFFTKDLDKELQHRGIKHLYLLRGQNTDSGSWTAHTASFEGIDKYSTDLELLHPLLTDMRVIKTEREIQLLRVGNLVSSQAHVYVMRHIKRGMMEVQLEALFKAWTNYFGGARHMAYTCICGSGAHGSVLHYGHAGRPNDRFLEEGDSVVLDMGAEYCGYATDITRSYPVSGVFTEDQRLIHEAVREAQSAVMKAMKPGVSWLDMHRLAERIIIRDLMKIGILHRGTLEEMEAAHMGSVFMPHGLGHLLGLDVHDVGGYPKGVERAKEPGVCYLRMGRKLEKGMVVTVEPGIYFNDPTLDKAMHNPEQARFINHEILETFRGTGGVRLEDDVLVTEDGIENLTILPTSADEIEEVMAAVHKRL